MNTTNNPAKSNKRLVFFVVGAVAIVFCCIIFAIVASVSTKLYKENSTISSKAVGDDTFDPDASLDYSNVSQEPFVSGQFLPKVNGFAFQNYGNESGMQNLTPAQMYDMFGKNVCLNGSRENCKLNNVAETWMLEVNNNLQIGHCAGFTILSNFMKSGYVSPSKFGGSNAYALSQSNKELQSEIAKWASYQFISNSYTQPINSTPAEVINILSKPFPADGYMLLVFQPGYKAGHAVTPTRVIDAGSGKYKIGIYDNNLPGIERYVDVNTSSNTWSYYATINPGYPEAEYSGDDFTQTLLLVRTDLMKNKPDCGDKCEVSHNYLEDETSSATSKSTSSNSTTSADEVNFDNEQKLAIEHQIIFSTNNEFEITDPNGNRFTYKNGEIEDKSNSISFVPIVSGVLWNDSLPPVVNLEKSGVYKMRVYKGEKKSADFAYFNKTYAFKMQESLIIDDYADLSVDTQTMTVTVDTKSIKPNNVEVENTYDDYDQTLNFEDMDFYDDSFEFSLDSENNAEYSMDGLKETELTIDRSSADGDNSLKYNLKFSEEEARQIDLYIHSSDNPIMFEADMKVLNMVKDLEKLFEEIYP
ncbi:hypothetical protein IPJ91_00925 [bacterium]|nr:MAG: hypothetical protein IPJ91_00925 [bacterium]